MYSMYLSYKVCWRSRASRHEEVPPPEPAASSQPGQPGQGNGATERLQFITVQWVGVLRKLHCTVVVPCRGPEMLVNRLVAGMGRMGRIGNGQWAIGIGLSD
jgi:hypothetical protein